ncbi:MAG: hypothetical protein ABI972_03180 [Acidobacteriota bacterium]
MLVLFLLFALLPAAAAGPLEVRVYSELRRVGPDGAVIEADSIGHPREIISPAVPRQAFSSFRIVVSAPAGKYFSLFLGHNPEHVLQTTLYKETWTQVGKSWVPDGLQKVSTPYTGMIPEAALGPEQQAVQSFWLDVYAPSQAQIRRVRLEVQLNSGDDWIIYPMEVRIESLVSPKPDFISPALSDVRLPASETAFQHLETYLCGVKQRHGASPPNGRMLIFRNAQQDVLWARMIEKVHGRDFTVAGILSAIGAPDAKTWCEQRLEPRAPYDPESYWKVRNWLMKNAEQ